MAELGQDTPTFRDIPGNPGLSQTNLSSCSSQLEYCVGSSAPAIPVSLAEVPHPCSAQACAFRVSWSGTLRGHYFFKLHAGSPAEIISQAINDNFAIFVGGQGKTCFAVTATGADSNQSLRRYFCHTFETSDSFIGWPCFAECALSSPLLIVVDPILEDVPPIIPVFSGCTWKLPDFLSWTSRFNPDEEVSNDIDGWSLKLAPRGITTAEKLLNRPYFSVSNNSLPEWATIELIINRKIFLVNPKDLCPVGENLVQAEMNFSVQPFMLPPVHVSGSVGTWGLPRALFDYSHELRSMPFTILSNQYQLLLGKSDDDVRASVVAINAPSDLEVGFALSCNGTRITKTYHFGNSRGVSYPRLTKWPKTGNISITFQVFLCPIPPMVTGVTTASWVIPNIRELVQRLEPNDEVRSSYFTLLDSRWQLCIGLRDTHPDSTIPESSSNVSLYLGSEEEKGALFMMSLGPEAGTCVFTLPMSLSWTPGQVWGFKNVVSTETALGLSRDGSLTISVEIFAIPHRDAYSLMLPRNMHSRPKRCVIWVSRGLQKIPLLMEQITFLNVALIWIESTAAKAKGADALIAILEKGVEQDFQILGVIGEDDLSASVCDALALRFTGVANVSFDKFRHCRRNKLHQRECLASISSVRFGSFQAGDYALDWVTSKIGPGFPVIVKPVEGSGSQFCAICRGPTDLLFAFNHGINQYTAELSVNDSMLVEQFLEGIEYVINSVSFGPNEPVLILEVWRKQQQYVGRNILYDRQDLLAPCEIPHLLRTATHNILNALGLHYGASHLEVVLVTLANGEQCVECVELNARSAGHSSRTMPFDSFFEEPSAPGEPSVPDELDASSFCTADDGSESETEHVSLNERSNANNMQPAVRSEDSPRLDTVSQNASQLYAQYWSQFGVNQASIILLKLAHPLAIVPSIPLLPCVTAVFLRSSGVGSFQSEGIRRICSLHTFFGFDRDLSELHVGVIDENTTTVWPTCTDRIRKLANTRILSKKPTARVFDVPHMNIETKKTVDLFTVPGVILLYSRDGWDPINSDYAQIRAWENDGTLYALTPVLAGAVETRPPILHDTLRKHVTSEAAMEPALESPKSTSSKGRRTRSLGHNGHHLHCRKRIDISKPGPSSVKAQRARWPDSPMEFDPPRRAQTEANNGDLESTECPDRFVPADKKLADDQPKGGSRKDSNMTASTTDRDSEVGGNTEDTTDASGKSSDWSCSFCR